MEPSVFLDKASRPDDRALETTLGPRAALLDSIEDHLTSEYGEVEREWTFSGKKHGWSMRLVRKGRAVFYVVPLRDGFDIAFVLGDKAVAAAEKARLPKPLMQKLREARRYPEGRGLRFAVTSTRNLPSVKKLITLKLAR